MWLNMYYILRAMIQYAKNINLTTSYYSVNYKDTRGTACAQVNAITKVLQYLEYPFNDGLADQTNTTYTGLGFHVGTGTTPVTATDYKLEAEITSGVNRTISTTNDVAAGVMRRHMTITNSSTDFITITEIGITVMCNSGYSTTARVLVYREVLEEPIVLAAGESFTFTLTDTFAIPETT